MIVMTRTTNVNMDVAAENPERTVEKNRSQKRQRIGAATTWLTAPEWIFLSSLDGRYA